MLLLNNCATQHPFKRWWSCWSARQQIIHSMASSLTGHSVWSCGQWTLNRTTCHCPLHIVWPFIIVSLTLTTQDANKQRRTLLLLLRCDKLQVIPNRHPHLDWPQLICHPHNAGDRSINPSHKWYARSESSESCHVRQILVINNKNSWWWCVVLLVSYGSLLSYLNMSQFEIRGYVNLLDRWTTSTHQILMTTTMGPLPDAAALSMACTRLH